VIDFSQTTFEIGTGGTPIKLTSSTGLIQAAVDSATIGDTVRLFVNNTLIETQILTAANETKTFTFIGTTYLNTTVVQVTRHVGGKS